MSSSKEHVFVSYNRRDQESVRQIVRHLDSSGFRLWFDEDDVGSGVIVTKIENALAQAYAFIVMLGPEGLGKWQQLEYETAVHQWILKRRPTIPVLLPGADIASAPLLLQGLNYIDFRSGIDEAGIARLAYMIERSHKKNFQEHVNELHQFEHDFVQVLLSDFSLKRKNTGMTLRVEFNHLSPAIATRKARRFIRKSIIDFDSKWPHQDDLLNEVYFGHRRVFRPVEAEFPYRYASGGTLPVVYCQGRRYYCLFLRNIHPIGWNIANGGCNSMRELRDPTLTIYRELCEELLIVDRNRWYVFDEERDEARDRPEFAVGRDYWNGIFDKLGRPRFEELRRSLIPPPIPAGPDRLLVKFHKDRWREYSDLFVTVTAEDFGIEIDRCLNVELPDQALEEFSFCDGEINAKSSVNRPVGLFDVDTFPAETLEEKEMRYRPDYFYHGAKFHRGTELEHVIENAILPDLRREVAQKSLSDHVAKEFHAQFNVAPGFKLCPVARQLIRRRLLTEV